MDSRRSWHAHDVCHRCLRQTLFTVLTGFALNWGVWVADVEWRTKHLAAQRQYDLLYNLINSHNRKKSCPISSFMNTHNTQQIPSFVFWPAFLLLNLLWITNHCPHCHTIYFMFHGDISDKHVFRFCDCKEMKEGLLCVGWPILPRGLKFLWQQNLQTQKSCCRLLVLIKTQCSETDYTCLHTLKLL